MLLLNLIPAPYRWLAVALFVASVFLAGTTSGWKLKSYFAKSEIAKIEADRAQVYEERAREQAALLRKPILKAIGFCYNCSDGIGHGMIFCSKDCAEDWQRFQDAKTRNGT